MLVVYFIYTACLAVYLAQALRLLYSMRRWQLSLQVPIILGLMYDNLILGLGESIGADSDLLQVLSYPRFYMHALFTPLLIMVGFFLVRDASGVVECWAQKRSALWLFWIVTLWMIGLGIYTDIVQLDLQQVSDPIRYTNASAKFPPVPCIVAILILIGCGVSLYKKQKCPDLLVGSMIMFVLSAAGGKTFGAVTNMGEVLLVASLMSTFRKCCSSMERNEPPLLLGDNDDDAHRTSLLEKSKLVDTHTHGCF